MSDRFLRHKHRKDTKTFLWGTGLMGFLTLVLGYDTWQGFASGQWVAIGAKMMRFMAPWRVATALTFSVLLLAVWCFNRYLKLKRTAPRYEPGDEKAGDV